MSARAQVLLWAKRVVARRGSPAHMLLEVAEHATSEQVQEAFHKIARTSHPDLHRGGLDDEELELVTSAYAAVAGAYQEMRIKCARRPRARANTQDGKPTGDPMIDEPPLPPRAQPQTTSITQRGMTRVAQPTPQSGARTRPSTHDDFSTVTPPGGPRTPQPSPPSGTHVPVTPSGPAPVGSAESKMSSKALLYYRKAELALKRGDLKGAILQIKLAIAADPNSAFLRTALLEVENEMKKG